MKDLDILGKEEASMHSGIHSDALLFDDGLAVISEILTGALRGEIAVLKRCELPEAEAAAARESMSGLLVALNASRALRAALRHALRGDVLR